MAEGDIVKYTPTSTVGKITDIRERGGKVWVKLDRTELYYDAGFLTPADVAEYKTTSFKERDLSGQGFRGSGRSIEDLHKMEEEVDISEMTPSGGG